MGYRFQDKVGLIIFEGTEYDGAEVKVRLNIAFGEYLTLGRAPRQELYDSFANHLLGWNLEDVHGDPIPVTQEGLYRVEPAFLDILTAKWLEAIVAVSSPLVAISADGNTLEAEPIPAAVP